jgi:hypothetical protein
MNTVADNLLVLFMAVAGISGVIIMLDFLSEIFGDRGE